MSEAILVSLRGGNMVIDIRTWARVSSPGAKPQPIASPSVLQNSINSLHAANASRKMAAQQVADQTARSAASDTLDKAKLESQ
jgi:hypothetical protein